MVANGELACPSAQPDMEKASVFGVVLGSVDAPRVAYLERALPVEDAVSALAAAGGGAGSVSGTGTGGGGGIGAGATMVFRVAATCETSACVHYSGSCCTLAARCDEQLEAVVAMLPRCAIRSRCRWFAERGSSICHRCPQVVTLNGPESADEMLRAVASPPPAGTSSSPAGPT
jgi:hypothetical protein